MQDLQNQATYNLKFFPCFYFHSVSYNKILKVKKKHFDDFIETSM